MNIQEEIQERRRQKLTELIDGIDAGDFAEVGRIPEKYTYGHLEALFFFLEILDNGAWLYEWLYDLAMECGRTAIMEKAKRGEKIKVVFLTVSAAQWPAEEVYRLIEADRRCESYIVVCPLAGRDKEDMKRTYIQTYRFLEQSNHEVRKSYDEETESYLGWEVVGGIPDIVIHLNPWYRALPEAYQIESLPLKCINCYIPYGIYVENSEDGKYLEDVAYNRGFVNMLWKAYTDSERNREGYRIYGLLRGKNVLYSGYAKMDFFFHKKNYGVKELKTIWKIPASREEEAMKRVIIAPHHSIRSSAGLAFSTFHKNVYFWLYLAQKYSDKISFIFKPHPNLRFKAVETGVFESFDAYDAYLAKWEELPNARVVQEADYRDIFATSDGMIMDSISFLAEYMYVDKPLLFLRRKGQAFNDLGQEILQCCYQAQGEDYRGIEDFLNRIILGGNDERDGIRREVFERELNYPQINRCMAAERIYQDISSLFGEDPAGQKTDG